MVSQLIFAAAFSFVVGGHFLIIGKLIEEFSYDLTWAEVIIKIGSFISFIVAYLLGFIGLIMILIS